MPASVARFRAAVPVALHRPYRMVVVDQEYMAVAVTGMPVRVAVGLRPLPAFVRVIMMFIMHM